MENNKSKLSDLWEMRNLSVDEVIKKISQNHDLKFLLTAAGIWLMARWLIGLWIAGHVVYFVYRIFTMVLH